MGWTLAGVVNWPGEEVVLEAAAGPEVGTSVVSIEDVVRNPFGSVVVPTGETDDEVEDVVEVGGSAFEETLVATSELFSAGNSWSSSSQ